MWPLAILASVVVLAIAFGLAFGIIFHQNPTVDTPATAPGHQTVSAAPTETTQPPESPCDIASVPVPFHCWYYKLGEDMIPAFQVVSSIDGTVIGLGRDLVAGVISMAVDYASAANAQDLMIAYVQWLRDFSGFLQGPMQSGDGYFKGTLWRLSVDSGAVVSLDYTVDGTKASVSVNKDWSLGSLDGQIPTISHNWLSGNSTLTIQPANGWTQYDTWQNTNKYYTTRDALTFARTVGGEVVGTLLVTHASFSEPPFADSAAGIAEMWITDFHPQPPEIGIAPASTIDVAGTTAVTHNLVWQSALFRWVVIPDANGAFVILAITRVDSPAKPEADIESMLSSIVLSR